MPVLLVLTAAGAWLLLGAGLLKIYRPEGTADAIRALTGIGKGRVGARLLGAGEVTISIVYIVWPGWISALAIGTTYAGVFASAWVLRVRNADCGCFGAASAEVSRSHLAMTLVAAVSSLGLAVFEVPEPTTYVFPLTVSAIPVALGAYAVIAPLNQLRSRLVDLRA